MVNKLRKKFVITAILSLLLILVTMIGIINAINMHQVVSDADDTLALLSSNNGYFPAKIISKATKATSSFKTPGAFDWEVINSNHSAETTFQARYFWVKMDSHANTIKINTVHIASVSHDIAEQYAKDLYFSNSRKLGFYHSYRYLISDASDGTKLLLFLDLSTAIINAKQLMVQSLAIGILALIAMFILVFLFSGQAVAPAVESLEKQKRFITDAGHELKTPLAVISANIDVLELEQGKNEWTSSIRNQLKRMNSLVKNMLTLSRLDEERMHVVFTDFDLSETLKDAAVSFEPIAESQEKKYKIDIPDGIHIVGNKSSMNQLACLLIDNAFKYSSQNGSIHVLLSMGKHIVFEVSNTCDTIPYGNLDRLFDRFYRADYSRSRETGGYGIGLSVARAIVTSHGGTIEAIRDGDKIIRFVVTLPKSQNKNTQKNK
ncbi:MAG: HAMP domain-containing histidine kinase [Butyrivibrio sp.]|nr:HAMP domain-containing histidine kinase [Butyrivibrio sp.]